MEGKLTLLGNLSKIWIIDLIHRAILKGFHVHEIMQNSLEFQYRNTQKVSVFNAPWYVANEIIHC